VPKRVTKKPASQQYVKNIIRYYAFDWHRKHETSVTINDSTRQPWQTFTAATVFRRLIRLYPWYTPSSPPPHAIRTDRFFFYCTSKWCSNGCIRIAYQNSNSGQIACVSFFLCKMQPSYNNIVKCLSFSDLNTSVSSVFTEEIKGDQPLPPHMLYIICKRLQSPNLRPLFLKARLLDKNIISPPKTKT